MDQDAIDRITGRLLELDSATETAGLAVTGRILRIARRIEGAREELLADHGLSVADFDVLATLRRRAEPDGLKAKDLQAAVMISSGGMTKRLDRLQSAGLIERHPDPDDRRGVLIRLTNDGRGMIGRALPALLAAEADMIDRAIGSVRDQQRMVTLLRRLLLALDT